MQEGQIIGVEDLSPTYRGLFAIQGGLADPAHLRAHVPTEQAIRTPLEQSDARLLAVNEHISQQQELARQHELAKGPDDPNRGGPVR